MTEEIKTVDRQDTKELTSICNAIFATHLRGLIRINEAAIAGHALLGAVAHLHRSDKENTVPSEVIKLLSSVDLEAFRSFDYINDLSHLIYVTTLFDTFLNEITIFLLLLHPKAIGKDSTIPINAVLKSTSRAEIINMMVSKKARDLSYLSFMDRLKFLQDTFGLHISIDSEEIEPLEHYSSVRNTAVHDQGIYQINLSETHHIEIKQKTCPYHPTLITNEDFEKSKKIYDAIVRKVMSAVLTQVLKIDGSTVSQLVDSPMPSSPNTGQIV
jgi:hypothetical protein